MIDTIRGKSEQANQPNLEDHIHIHLVITSISDPIQTDRKHQKTK